MIRGALLSTVLLGLISVSLPGITAQGSFELSQQDFLVEVFGDSVPEPKRLWIKGDLKSALQNVLGHKVNFLRAPYWHADDTTVWLLHEVGKTKPITTAVVVQRQESAAIIKQIKVLVFRESRGWEVKYPFFTRQFEGLARKPEGGLAGRIDGITGATLSVNALRKQAEIALLLEQHVQAQ